MNGTYNWSSLVHESSAILLEHNSTYQLSLVNKKEKVEEVFNSKKLLDKDGEIDYLVKTELCHQYWFLEDLVSEYLRDEKFETNNWEDPEEDGDIENEGEGSDYLSESSEENSEMEL